MEDNNFYNENEFKLNYETPVRCLIGVAIGYIGLSLFASLYMIIISLFYKNPELYQNEIMSYVYFLAYASLVLTLCLFFSKSLKKIYAKYKNMAVYGKSVLYGIGLLFITMVYSMFISQFLPDLGDNVNQSSLEIIMKESPLLSFFFIVIFAPISEELTYRYSLFGGISKKNKYLGYAICGLIFGFIHFDLSGIFTMTKDQAITEWANLPTYIISGLYLCYVYDHEKSLIASTGAHMTNNLWAYIATFISSNLPPEEISSSLTECFLPLIHIL